MFAEFGSIDATVEGYCTEILFDQMHGELYNRTELWPGVTRDCFARDRRSRDFAGTADVNTPFHVDSEVGWFNLSSRPKHEQLGYGIAVQRNGLFAIQSLRVINLDSRAGAVDIELPAVAAHSKVESRPAFEFELLDDLSRSNIEYPKFGSPVAALPAVGNRVAFPSVGRQQKSVHLRRGPYRREVDVLGGQVDSRDAKDRPANNRVGRVENRSHKSRLFVGIVVAANIQRKQP